MQLPCVGGAMVPYTKTSLLYIGGKCKTKEGEWRASEVIYQFQGDRGNDVRWMPFTKLEQVKLKFCNSWKLDMLLQNGKKIRECILRQTVS